MNPRTRVRLHAADEGRIALLVIVLAFAVLAMIGLSVDGGGKVRASERADNLASEAARAAGQAILPRRPSRAARRSSTRPPPWPPRRTTWPPPASRGTVTVSDDRNHVTVTVTIVYRTVFLGLIGITTLTATRHATAVLVST